ncbi:hypothetical protein IC582_007734 [Cucumis melo]|uniref:Uncharacterized protein n=1 Tax=Cucumis melo TaxID=3656 RepID=A0A9I9DGR3_CUCME
MANENSTDNNSLNYHGDESPEDSGWTIYFEDFLNSNNSNSHNQSLTSFSSSHFSLDVNDAASSIAHHKLPHDHNDQVAVQPEFGYKDDDHINVFKKRKMIKELFVKDEALEDTASSPVNSPKVSCSTYFSKNQDKDNLIVPEVEERKEMGDLIEIGNKYTELKKRGLCLVPLSMVLNYLPQ